MGGAFVITVFYNLGGYETDCETGEKEIKSRFLGLFIRFFQKIRSQLQEKPKNHR